MVPAAWEKKAIQLLPHVPRLAKAAYGALTSMGVGAVQGADPGEMELLGFLGTLPAGADWLKAAWGEKLPARVLNSIIRPAMKAFGFSKNPGRGVAEEGIVAGTLESLGKKVAAAR